MGERLARIAHLVFLGYSFLASYNDALRRGIELTLPAVGFEAERQVKLASKFVPGFKLRVRGLASNLRF